MKVKDENLAKQGANKAKHEQEDTASRDYEKQRQAAAKEVEVKAKEPKKSGK